MNKCLLIFCVFLTLHTAAQSAFDENEKKSHFEIGLEAATHNYFAAQKFAIKGPVFSPYSIFQHKSGFYVSAQPNFFTDTSITNKTKLPELEMALGYKYLSERFQLDVAFVHSKINYGNKVFKKFLNNAFILDGVYSITDNLDVQGNITVLEGKAKKSQTTPFYTLGFLYNFYVYNTNDNFKIIVSPNMYAYIGSSKVYDAMSLKNDININSLNIKNNTSFQALQAGINVVFQTNKLQFLVAANEPYSKYNFKSTTTPVTTTYKFGKFSTYLVFGLRCLIPTVKNNLYK